MKILQFRRPRPSTGPVMDQIEAEIRHARQRFHGKDFHATIFILNRLQPRLDSFPLPARLEQDVYLLRDAASEGMRSDLRVFNGGRVR